jgi:hypothetical protein
LTKITGIGKLGYTQKFFREKGFSKFEYIPFEIDIDLPKPVGTGFDGTYTETLKNGERIQISGPILMSWYFVLAQQ